MASAPTNVQMIAAIERSRGLVAVAARMLGCSRKTVHARIRAVASVRAALEDARELVLDEAEGRLFAAITRDEAWAITFLLRTIGRSRGYMERSEVSLIHQLDRLSDRELDALEALPDHLLSERLGLREEPSNGRH